MAEETRRRCVDKLGAAFDVTYGTLGDRSALAAMYDRFVPKAMTQGLPASDDAARFEWVTMLLETGENFLAWQEGVVIGHSSLIVDSGKGDGEYLIFMDQSCRRRGIGTILTRLAVERARDLKLHTIWLTVEALNFRAIKLYQKMGFVFCDVGERERTMTLEL
jgi:RimJ/RimL family protein N-acetyltransferase